MYLPNPLDEFETYSVHYIMLACRTTVTAQKFASDDDKAMATSLAAINATKALGQPVIIDGNANDVFLVIDTRRFSQFTIESLKYDVIINGLQKAGNTTANLATDMTMTVLDSVGISFANFLQWLMDKQLKTNYDGLIFMLRTIFVGHKSDGTTHTIQTETIPLHLSKMEINLDYAKGAYNLEFMPNMNFDVNRFSRWMTVSLATTYKTGKGQNNLGSLINSFQKELNEKSMDYYNRVQKTIEDSGAAKAIGSKTLGRPVQYMITIPKSWEPFEVLGATPGGAPETKYYIKQNPPKTDDKNKATTATPTSNTPSGSLQQTYTAVKPSMTIPKVLDAIFEQVPDINKLGNFKQADASSGGFITFFKYLVGITSDDKTMVVHVDVVEFKVPNVFTQKPEQSTATVVGKQEKEFYTTTTQGGVTKREPNNFIEFDYIFTGKNKDILNFDLKIQDFQFLLASNIRIGDNAIRDAADAGGSSEAMGVTAANSELLYAREYDPLLMPADSEAALKNFSQWTTFIKTREQQQKNISEAQQYTKNLSMFYAASPITAALTIKGNPLIMHKFNMGKLLQHPGASQPGGSTQSAAQIGGISNEERVAYRKNLENEILRTNGGLEKNGDTFVMKTNLDSQSYAIAPVFAKINIKGPSVDFRTNEPTTEDKDFATSVLSDNYYVVFKVTNIIQGHSFTQELELYSHNIFGRSKITKDSNSPMTSGATA